MVRNRSAERGYRSGELAAAAGVSPDTLRHYERRGLLAAPPRLANGYRIYPREALDRILLIQRGLSIGFSLAELRMFLKARQAGAAPCKQVHELATRRLSEVERQIEELRLFRDELRKILGAWGRRLDARPDGAPARLLETLSSQSIAPGGEAPRALRFVHRAKKKEAR